MPEKKCTGDCLKCSLQQQVYCAAQHGHAIMEFMPAIIARLDSIAASVPNFAPQEIINPLKDNAQKDSGAENRESETN